MRDRRSRSSLIGVESAVEQARAVAGEKDVAVGNASIAQQCIRAGLLDEIHIDLVPILLKGGLRACRHLSQGADDVDACEEVIGSLFVAGCDGAKVLDDVEETFHEVALAIEREVALARRLAICPRRNDGLDAADFEMLDEAVANIAFVGEEGCGFDFLGQDLGLRYVVNVSAGEAHRQRIAWRIDDGVNLGRQSSARAADRFIRIPFFRAPALCWWALTTVASIMAYSLSGPRQLRS